MASATIAHHDYLAPPPPPPHRYHSSATTPTTVPSTQHEDEDPGSAAHVHGGLCRAKSKVKRFFSRRQDPKEDEDAAKEAAERHQRRASLAPTFTTHETTFTDFTTSTTPPPIPLPPIPAGYTSPQLAVLINRWMTTQPGPSTHPQNVEIADLVAKFRESSAPSPENNLLWTLLTHRRNMDQLIERLAKDIGLRWDICVERFVPPPNRPLSAPARELLRGAGSNDWVGWLMPEVTVEGEGGAATVDRKIRQERRYRKVKYWLFEVAASNGWTLSRLDRRVARWFSSGGG